MRPVYKGVGGARNSGPRHGRLAALIHKVIKLTFIFFRGVETTNHIYMYIAITGILLLYNSKLQYIYIYIYVYIHIYWVINNHDMGL